MNKQKILTILKNIAAIIVVIAMFIVIYYQNRDRDIFKFGKDESSKLIASSQNSGAFYGGDIARLDDKVAFLTTTDFTIVNKKGEAESIPMAISDPNLHVKGDWSACYDADSKEIVALKKASQEYTVKTNNKIISAKINKNGYLLAVTEKEGYNCECVVYNSKGEAIFKWDVSKSEFLDGDINATNDTIALSLASAGNDKLVGEVSLIDITTAEVIRKETFDSEIFYSMNFNNDDTYVLLGNASLTYFNSDGTKRWAYKFVGDSLIKADISKKDSFILAFDSANIAKGKSTDVKVINSLGEVVAENNYTGTLDAISQNDDSIALAFGNKIRILNSKLKEKKQTEAEFNIKKMVLYKDSKHIFVLGNSGGDVIE